MQVIIDFFVGIYNVIEQLINFAIGIIEDLVYVVRLTGQFVARIPVYFAWMPSAPLTLLVTIFGIVVVYKILGREG